MFGYKAGFMYLPHYQVNTAVLANYDSESIEIIANELVQIIVTYLMEKDTN